MPKRKFNTVGKTRGFWFAKPQPQAQKSTIKTKRFCECGCGGDEDVLKRYLEEYSKTDIYNEYIRLLDLDENNICICGCGLPYYVGTTIKNELFVSSAAMFGLEIEKFKNFIHLEGSKVANLQKESRCFYEMVSLRIKYIGLLDVSNQSLWCGALHAFPYFYAAWQRMIRDLYSIPDGKLLDKRFRGIKLYSSNALDYAYVRRRMKSAYSDRASNFIYAILFLDVNGNRYVKVGQSNNPRRRSKEHVKYLRKEGIIIKSSRILLLIPTNDGDILEMTILKYIPPDIRIFHLGIEWAYDCAWIRIYLIFVFVVAHYVSHKEALINGK